MPGMRLLLLIGVARLAFAADESWLVRVQEDALAKALNAKNAATVSALVDPKFHLDVTEVSGERTFTLSESREDWLNDVKRVRNGSYEATVSSIRGSKAGLAMVGIDESWVIETPRGVRIEKHFITMDLWSKSGGTWKLATRVSQARR